MLHIDKLPKDYKTPQGITFNHSVYGVFENDRLILVGSLTEINEIMEPLRCKVTTLQSCVTNVKSSNG